MEKSLYRINSFSSAGWMVVLLMLMVSETAFAQTDRQHIRAGNRDYKSGKFSDSELSYRRATEIPKSTPDAWFNLGNAIYKQNRYDDAASTFEKNAAMNENEIKKANSYYNLGNALLNSQKIEESIDAYKKALRLNPKSLEAKYNLAYAQDMLQQQQQQQQQDQEQNQQQDQENKNDPSDNNKNKNEDKDQSQDQDQNQNQNSQQQISMEDAKRLLEALAGDEQKIQEKVKKDKAAAGLIRTIKNW